MTEEGQPILLKKSKDCVHSVVFATKDPEAAVKSIYVDRALAGDWNEIVITLTRAGAISDRAKTLAQI